MQPMKDLLDAGVNLTTTLVVSGVLLLQTTPDGKVVLAFVTKPEAFQQIVTHLSKDDQPSPHPLNLQVADLYFLPADDPHQFLAIHLGYQGNPPTSERLA